MKLIQIAKELCKNKHFFKNIYNVQVLGPCRTD